MKRGLSWLLSVILMMGAASVFGQEKSVSDSLEKVMEQENAHILNTMDSLSNLLFKPSNALLHDTVTGFENDEIPTYSDSVYAYRLSQLPTVIPMDYNQYVDAFIHLYAIKRREQVQRMLGLSEFYFPMFEETFDKYGIPMELKYLAIVESALNPHAVSRAGATGLWQFMYSTARLYGMQINSYIDQRKDPVIATDGAAHFLSDMYDVYGDWLLVIAAYNCGPGNVNKAIRRSGGKRTFWEIRNWLPRETRGYVPAFIAANYIMNYYKEHNIVPVQPDYPYFSTDTVWVDKRTSLSQIAEHTKVDEEVLAFLNPSFKKGLIPPAKDPHILKLPSTAIIAFDEKRDTIFSGQSAAQKPVKTTAQYVKYTSGSSRSSTSSSGQPSRTAASRTYNSQYNTEGKTKISYTVKTGDNLGFIAEWYDCRVSDLKNWNNIYGNMIRVGQKLSVYVPDEKADQYSKVDQLSFDQKQRVEKKDQKPAISPIIFDKSNNADYILYTVKSGDTLWDIAKKYPGISVENIKQINNIQDGRSLKPGMVIRIKKLG